MNFVSSFGVSQGKTHNKNDDEFLNKIVLTISNLKRTSTMKFNKSSIASKEDLLGINSDYQEPLNENKKFPKKSKTILM